MTTTDFQQRHPKPWRLVTCQTSLSLRDANGLILGRLDLNCRHVGIPQKEWNRHVAAALREYLTVEEQP